MDLQIQDHRSHRTRMRQVVSHHSIGGTAPFTSARRGTIEAVSQPAFRSSNRPSAKHRAKQEPDANVLTVERGMIY